MNGTLVQALRTLRPRLLRQWEGQLRALPPCSALAHPDTLVHLMGPTYDRVVELIDHDNATPASLPADCECGKNPLVTFFVTGEASLIEGIVADQVNWRPQTSEQRLAAVKVLRNAVRCVAADDIEAFCSLCQRKGAARTDCRAPSAVSAPA